MVTGPAKNGDSCNQVLGAEGSGIYHQARLQASLTLSLQAAGRHSRPQTPVTLRITAVAQG